MTVVERLLAQGGVGPGFKDNTRSTPLSWVAWEGYGVVIEMLLAKDRVDAVSKDDNSRTPLSLAKRDQRTGHVEEMPTKRSYSCLCPLRRTFKQIPKPDRL